MNYPSTTDFCLCPALCYEMSVCNLPNSSLVRWNTICCFCTQKQPFWLLDKKIVQFLTIQARISDAFISAFLGYFLFEYVQYIHSYVLNVGQKRYFPSVEDTWFGGERAVYYVTFTVCFLCFYLVSQQPKSSSHKSFWEENFTIILLFGHYVKNAKGIGLYPVVNAFTFFVRNLKDCIYVGVWYR